MCGFFGNKGQRGRAIPPPAVKITPGRKLRVWRKRLQPFSHYRVYTVMESQSGDSSSLLEQAHLALMRGNLPQAQTLLDRLTALEPNNSEAQSLRATLIARQAAGEERARLQTDPYPGMLPPTLGGSLWTRPIPDPVNSLLKSQSARKWSKPRLLLSCLGAGVATAFAPFGRHRHFYYSSYSWNWELDLIFGLIGGLVLFIIILARRR